MKPILLITGFLIAIAALAQPACTINNNCNQVICPDTVTNLPDAYINQAYNTSLTIAVPQDTTFQTQVGLATYAFDSMVFENWNLPDSINLPPGITAACNNQISPCTFYPNIQECVGLSGMVTNTANAGIWPLSLKVRAYLTCISPSFICGFLPKLDTAFIYSGYHIKVVNSCAAATPLITASGTTSICPEDSVILSASSASSYQWSNGEMTQSITVKTAGSYTVAIIDGNGCSGTSAATTVTMLPPATASISSASPLAFCQGDSAILTANTATAYLWNNGASAQSITVDTAGTYFVIATDGNGCRDTASATISVYPLPYALISADGPAAVCINVDDTIMLQVNSAVAYVWNTGQTSQSIAVDSTGLYTVTITNSDGCSGVSPAVSITFNLPPEVPVITANGAVLTSSAMLNNQWYFNGNPIAGEIFQNFTAPQDGMYSIKVTDSAGCSSMSEPFNYIFIGMIEPSMDSFFSIQPNPAKGKFWVISNSGKASITVLNSAGKKVFQTVTSSAKTEIDLSAHPKGIYIIQLSAGGKTLVKRVAVE